MSRYLWLALSIVSVIVYTVFTVIDIRREAWPLVALDVVFVIVFAWVLAREVRKARAAKTEAS